MRRAVRWALAGAAAALLAAGCADDPAASTSTSPATTPSPTVPARELVETVAVASDDVELHVEAIGPSDASQTVVAIHGGPGLSLAAAEPYRHLAATDRRVVLFDQRGAGRSTAPADGDHGLEAQLRDIEAVRTAMGAMRVHVIGESFGSLIASTYAATHPERVASLALVAASPLDRAVIDDGIAAVGERIAELQADGLVPATLPANEGDSCLPALDATAPAYQADPHDDLDVQLGSCSAVANLLTREQIFASPLLAEAATRLGDFTGPALVLSGEADPFGRLMHDRTVELLASAEVTSIVLPDVAHRPGVEARAALLDALEEHLAGA